jgi:hypothetical protein
LHKTICLPPTCVKHRSLTPIFPGAVSAHPTIKVQHYARGVSGMPVNLRLRSLQIERECCIFQMGPDRLAGFPENGRAAQRDPGKRRVCSPSVQTVETMQCLEDDRRGGNRNWPSAQIREARKAVFRRNSETLIAKQQLTAGPYRIGNFRTTPSGNTSRSTEVSPHQPFAN